MPSTCQEGEAGFGYVMEDGHDIPPLMFTRDEIVALVAGARIARAWGGATMARAAEEALIKIAEVLPPDAKAQAQAVEVHSFAPEMTPELRDRIDEIETATKAARRGAASAPRGAAASTPPPRPARARESPWAASRAGRSKSGRGARRSRWRRRRR